MRKKNKYYDSNEKGKRMWNIEHVEMKNCWQSEGQMVCFRSSSVVHQ